MYFQYSLELLFLESEDPDKDIMINVTVYNSADDFAKWLDYHKQ